MSRIRWGAAAPVALFALLTASTVLAQPEACGDGGGGANDIRSLSAIYEPVTGHVVVTLRLCAEPDSTSKYRVRFDSGPNLVEYPSNSGTFVNASLADGNPFCLDTDDTGLMLANGRTHGPGTIVVVGDTMTFTVPVTSLSPAPAETVRYRADVQYRGIADMAPRVDASDGCSRPQVSTEMQTVVLRSPGDVIGTQAFDILRDPSRRAESAMGNLVADAMRTAGAAIDVALTNSGGLRQDLYCSPPLFGEQPCEVTFGESFGVLPFGNTAVLVTLTGAQLEAALLNGLAPACNPAVSTGRFPQVSGLRIDFLCAGTTPVLVSLARTPLGVSGPHLPIGPADAVRVVTNDFLMLGGDGYAVLASGADIVYLDRSLLGLLIAFVEANSPVAPVVEGRIVPTVP